MFQETKSLSTIDLSHFYIGAESVNSMFNSATGFTSITLNNWDVTNVTNSSSVFSGITPTVYCDQGGSPGTVSIFDVPCN